LKAVIYEDAEDSGTASRGRPEFGGFSMKKPTALIIMDGFGINPSAYGNAIKSAKKPRLDKLMAECPMTTIGASGLNVGLPDGQMGNSEVGHTNIGAGRIVYQELTRISKSIEDGDFFTNPRLSQQSITARNMARRCISWALCPRAASTATIRIFTRS
jgi:bisphosphoglycerate-independent phosphoglycerate mutase (AlkP superfamily)